LPLSYHLQIIGRKRKFLEEKGDKKMVDGQRRICPFYSAFGSQLSEQQKIGTCFLLPVVRKYANLSL
jgi:hypothetical protein